MISQTSFVDCTTPKIIRKALKIFKSDSDFLDENVQSKLKPPGLQKGN